MPARALLKNYEWIAWTGGKPYKGKPYYKRGDVLLVADEPGQPWRTPEVPELDGKVGCCPDSLGPFERPGSPREAEANRFLAEMAALSPNFVVLEYFEVPELELQRPPLFDENGKPIVF